MSAARLLPRLLAALLAVTAAARAADAETSLARAQWIWGDPKESLCELRRAFVLEAAPVKAVVEITADNGYELYVNGSLAGREAGAAAEVWQSVERYDITKRLTKGRNVIGIHGIDLGNVRAVIAAVRVDLRDRPPLDFITDGDWRAATSVRETELKAVDYSHPEAVEGPEWRAADIVGNNGAAPWGVVAWSAEAERERRKRMVPPLTAAEPDKTFRWPGTVAFIGGDCSVYVPLRGDAWGVAFRIHDWSRAYTEFDLPCPSKIGRRLYTMETAPGAKPHLLLDAGSGVLGSPSASFDGKSLLVAMARPGEKFFHIHRVPVTGGEPLRLTDGPFHDIDPAELPDGRIVFTSTRTGTFEEYHQPPSRALFRMNADGSGIHPISSTLIFDNEPKVMADGRIAFIRTDNFFDRGKVETHLHVMRPDGTDGHTAAGASSGADYGSRLRAFGYGSPAPLPDGSLAFISNRGNFIAPSGTAEAHSHRLPGPLGDLAPLPDGRLLGTLLNPGGRGMESDVLAVIAPRDNSVTAIHRAAESIHSPVFVGARPRPPVLPDYADLSRAGDPSSTGFLFCRNARFTTKAKAGWENVRAIRILGAVPLTVRSSHSHIVHVGHETVELGTVPLAEDGSFHAEVPADTPIALQAVDAEGRSELNEMSWIYVRPGERRSCVGCHQQRQAAPPLDDNHALALLAPPLKTTGQGRAHRFRGNNAGVTGMMDLQFERFRETASLNRHDSRAANLSTRDEIAALRQALTAPDKGQRVSAAQSLAVFRTSDAAPELAAALTDSSREVRVAAALALAPCGNRDSISPLLTALEDKDATVAQAAAVALENLTGQTPPAAGKTRAASWRDWMASQPWGQIEQSLIAKLSAAPEPERRTVVALGHTGGDAARRALREYVRNAAAKNPYPPFVNDNRTDNFTFSAASPLNPRTLQEAVRALGQLHDSEAVPLLKELLAANCDPKKANLFLAEAAIESLGRIGTPECEDVLLAAFAALRDYWHYVGWYSDHPALYACHASPLHARILAALDGIGSAKAAAIVPQIIRSVPTDSDRALFPDNDDYETLAGRLIRRSGRGDVVVNSCLHLLGDPQAAPESDLKAALSTTHAAWAGHPGPENRAAQILSLVCRDAAREPQVRAAFQRFLDRPEEPVQRGLGNPVWTPVRHWVLFYLGRALGQLGSGASVDSLTAVLRDGLNEARHGRPDPAEPEIHFLHHEYTPCWRAAAAWALGRIGDRRAVPALLAAVRNMDNATDVRHTAAVALGAIADPASLPEMEKLAADYPEISTRRALLAAVANLRGGNPRKPSAVTFPDNSH